MKFTLLSLMLAMPLLLAPMPSSALLGLGDDIQILDRIVDDFDDTAPAVPEPSGAVIMGAALVTLAVVRRLRK